MHAGGGKSERLKVNVKISAVRDFNILYPLESQLVPMLGEGF